MASSSSVAAAGEAQIKIAGSAVSRALLNFNPSVVAFELAKFSEFTPRRVKEMALLEQRQQNLVSAWDNFFRFELYLAAETTEE